MTRSPPRSAQSSHSLHLKRRKLRAPHDAPDARLTKTSHYIFLSAFYAEIETNNYRTDLRLPLFGFGLRLRLRLDLDLDLDLGLDLDFDLDLDIHLNFDVDICP